MDRRTFLVTSSGLVLPYLAGCQPGTTGPDDAQEFTLGLAPATSEILANIATADPGSLRAITSSAAALADPQFDISDRGYLALAGYPALLPPTGNQGRLGSCVAWGVGYAMASVNKAAGMTESTAATQVSPADLYAKILRRESGNPCGNGTYIRDALDVLVEEGVASLAAMPYSDAGCVAPGTNPQIFINGYVKVAVTDRTAIKQALQNLLVLPFGMQVYDDFFQVRSAVYTGPSSGARLAGGHCMALVGHDDALGAYKLLNSWGTGWGNGGYGLISYSAFERHASEVYVAYPGLGFGSGSSDFNNLSDQYEGMGRGVVRGTGANTRVLAVSPGSTTGKAHVSFLLNDFLRLTGYRITFWKPGGGTFTPINVAEAAVQQSLRGGVLTSPAFPASLIAGCTFASVSLLGNDRTGAPTQLFLYMNFPGKGAR